MNFTLILAAGNGTRLQSEKPKQFTIINNRPMLFYSVETFTQHPQINIVVIVTHPQWLEQTKQLVNQIVNKDKIHFCTGGKSRNQSIVFGLEYLRKQFKLQPNDLILTHDSARPFVSKEIISANLQAMQTNVAVNTAINSQDTIFEAHDNFITQIPSREYMYLSQTPQTFNWKVIHDIYFNHQFDEALFASVDASTLAIKCGYSIGVVLGSKKNIKITTIDDLDKLIVN